MPAVSKAQRNFMGMVHAIHNGSFKGKPSKKLRDAAKSLSYQDAKDFASTKTKGLPDKKASMFDEMFVKGFLSRLSVR